MTPDELDEDGFAPLDRMARSKGAPLFGTELKMQIWLREAAKTPEEWHRMRYYETRDAALKAGEIIRKGTARFLPHELGGTWAASIRTTSTGAAWLWVKFSQAAE